MHMKINYYNKSVYKGGTEIPQDSSVVVDDDTKAFVATVCINIERVKIGSWTQASAIQLRLEETEEPLVLESPSQDPDALVQKLTAWQENYLAFPSSYISMSRIRPYGVGINTGDVTKSALQVKDVIDAFLDPTELFFHAPIMRRDADQSVLFHKKKPFSRKYDRPVDLPIFADESMDSFVQKNKDLNIGNASSWCSRTYPGKKVKVTNNGSRYAILPSKKWVPMAAMQNADHYTYFKVKRDVMESALV